jgi:hypothetical protein
VAVARRFWNSLNSLFDMASESNEQDTANLLIVKPSFDRRGSLRVMALEIRYTGGMTWVRHDYLPVGRSTHPLLLPFTLCSDNVISLWSMFTLQFKATWRRSSSVVHWRDDIQSIIARHRLHLITVTHV